MTDVKSENRNSVTEKNKKRYINKSNHPNTPPCQVPLRLQLVVTIEKFHKLLRLPLGLTQELS